MDPTGLCPVCGPAADLTGLLVCAQLNHLRCLHDFAEAQATYYAQCHHYMQELQRELSRSGSSTGGHMDLDSSDVEGNNGDSFMSVTHRGNNAAGAPPAAAGGPNLSSSASSSHGTLTVEQLPVTGTRKAKVLYDYDAHDASELSLLADEVRSQTWAQNQEETHESS